MVVDSKTTSKNQKSKKERERCKDSKENRISSSSSKSERQINFHDNGPAAAALCRLNRSIVYRQIKFQAHIAFSEATAGGQDRTGSSTARPLLSTAIGESLQTVETAMGTTTLWVITIQRKRITDSMEERHVLLRCHHSLYVQHQQQLVKWQR